MSKDRKGFDVADKSILNNVESKHYVNYMEKGIEIVMNLAGRRLILFITVYLDWLFSILDCEQNC